MKHSRGIVVILSICVMTCLGSPTTLGNESSTNTIAEAVSAPTQTEATPGIRIVNNPTPRPTLYPGIISRVNDGVSTILRGVFSGNLEEILRGSFKFTRNENVRIVANNVLDEVFVRTGLSDAISSLQQNARQEITSALSAARTPQIKVIPVQTSVSPNAQVLKAPEIPPARAQDEIPPPRVQDEFPSTTKDPQVVMTT